MRSPYLCFVILSVLLTVTLTAAQAVYNTRCPLLGPVWPASSAYAGDPGVRRAVQTIKQTIQSSINKGNFGNATSFSLDFFSGSETLIEYHHSAPRRSKLSVGASTVNSDTVYRLGSISKLHTVYIYLINVGLKNWQEPITAFVPELAQYAVAHVKTDTAINSFSFDDITIGSLASQRVGVPREFSLTPMNVQLGQVPGTTKPTGNYCRDPEIVVAPCTREDFFEALFSRKPVHPPDSTPVYSNNAYQLLGYALENQTGQSLTTLFDKTLVEPLGLKATSFYAPSPQNAVVPVNTSVSWFSANITTGSPGGGYYSSLSDARVILRSILNSSYLPPHVTRQWLKPATFTADGNASVGAPWEIFRAPSRWPSYLYTKDGDLGSYSSQVSLLPDYGVGFTVLAASADGNSPAHTVFNSLSSLLSETFVPTIEAATRNEANTTYVSRFTNVSSNSTFSFATAVSDPGLILNEWIVEGFDLIVLLSAQFKANVTVHLYPTGQHSPDGSRVAWRAVIERLPQPLDNKTFSQNCASWNGVDGLFVGREALDDFVFEIGDGGHAIGVEFAAASAKAMRVG